MSRIGTIVLPNANGAIECLIQEITATGACLKLAALTEFRLIFSLLHATGRPERRRLFGGTSRPSASLSRANSSTLGKPIGRHCSEDLARLTAWIKYGGPTADGSDSLL